MSSTTALPSDPLSLLDRLDPSLDEPCNVEGCIHLTAEALTPHDVVAGRVPA